ncbi:uncharacterized protein BDW70DRAFT_152217 [Aspergillus foveolatus]|uniref:uncharacterized protein n=1 Tax=Aspergillus foveolatus TaxID=210207 RepID=UPI003CCDB17E
MLCRVFAFLLAASVFYVLSFSTIMSTPTPNLEVRLQPPSVSVQSKGESPATVLKWGSPLDGRANVLGIFEILDTENDKVVEITTVKFARQLPPPVEDFVEIPPGGKIDAEVKIPLVPLEQGKKYTIQAKGWWQAVWEQPLGDVPRENLEKLEGALRGEYVSEAVPVEVDR